MFIYIYIYINVIMLKIRIFFKIINDLQLVRGNTVSKPMKVSHSSKYRYPFLILTATDEQRGNTGDSAVPPIVAVVVVVVFALVVALVLLWRLDRIFLFHIFFFSSVGLCLRLYFFMIILVIEPLIVFS